MGFGRDRVVAPKTGFFRGESPDYKWTKVDSDTERPEPNPVAGGTTRGTTEFYGYSIYDSMSMHNDNIIEYTIQLIRELSTFSVRTRMSRVSARGHRKGTPQWTISARTRMSTVAPSTLIGRIGGLHGA